MIKSGFAALSNFSRKEGTLMQENTYIADAVEIAKDKSEYDTAIKTIKSP